MKMINTKIITACIGFLLIQFSYTALAQESRQAPTELSREINQINFLIDEYQTTHQNFEKELSGSVDEMRRIHTELNSRIQNSENLQDLKLQYMHGYSKALKVRMEHLNELNSIIENISNSINRTQNMDFEAESEVEIVSNTVERFENMLQQYQEETTRTAILAEFAHDLNDDLRNQLKTSGAMTQKYGVNHTSYQREELLKMKQALQRAPNSNDNIRSVLRQVKVNIDAVSMHNRAGIMRLNTIREILLTRTKWMIEMNNIGEMVAKLNALTNSANKIRSISTEMDERLPMPDFDIISVMEVEMPVIDRTSTTINSLFNSSDFLKRMSGSHNTRTDN